MRRVGRAFSLVELLVVIALVALLIGVLLPALGSARATARMTKCLSNQRQMMTSTTVYALDSKGYFPPAIYGSFSYTPIEPGGDDAVFAWDFITIRHGSGGATHLPGLIWSGSGTTEIQQCPSTRGASNWSTNGQDDPATGYNYNTSFIGGPTEPLGGWGMTRSGKMPPTARLDDPQAPHGTVVFGDGAFGDTSAGLDGANKFMRSPDPGLRDPGVGNAMRAAGVQAFRHSGGTVAVFADTHAESMVAPELPVWSTVSTNLEDAGRAAGFLSTDNRLYDLLIGDPVGPRE